MQPEPKRTPELIDLSQIEGAFVFEEGFSRPDWKLVSAMVNERISGTHDLNLAWTEVARQWAEQLRSDLGGEYQVNESPQFILLSASGTEVNAKLLAFVEQTLDQIKARLGDAAWNSGHGKHVLFLFAEEDDYYQYVSYFYQEGLHPGSGGCLLRKGYVHIAAPYAQVTIHQMLAHELTHNCLAHLPVPLWLNEGLAKTFEHTVAMARYPVLDHDLKDLHLSFWNSQTIQEFWTGVSFGKPGDSNRLSYSLAEIFLTLLLERKGDWSAFIRQAHYRDAGQTAALDCLGLDLGDLASTFLGKGDWRPHRKAMVEIWEARKRERTEPDSA